MHKTESGQPTTFSVILPVLNGVADIRRTIESVLIQEGNFSVQLHVQDGASTDGTLTELEAIRREYEDGSLAQKFNDLTFSFRSEPDSGLYDAVRKGARLLAGADTAPMTWINAGDFFLPGAFAAVERIFSEHSAVTWLVPPTYVYEHSRPKLFVQMFYPREIVAAGMCDGIKWRTIQQEGCFWRWQLWNEAENAIDSMSLAGDWALWRRFAESADPYHVMWPMAAFTVHEGQLSGSSNKYRTEIERHRSKSATKEAFASIVRTHSSLNVAVVDTNYRIDWRVLPTQQLVAMGSTEELLVAIHQQQRVAVPGDRLVAEASSIELIEAAAQRDPKLQYLLDSGARPQEEHSVIFRWLRRWYRSFPDRYRVRLRPMVRRLFGR